MGGTLSSTAADLGLPLYVEDFCSLEDGEILLNACNTSRKISRLSTNRLDGFQYWSDLPVLRGPMLDIRDFLNSSWGLSLVPVRSTFYCLHPGGQLHLRTLTLENELTLALVIEGAENESFFFYVSDFMSNETRLANDFPRGIITCNSTKAEIIDAYNFYEMALKCQDALIFSPSNCFHFCRNFTESKISIIFFTFRTQENNHGSRQ